MPNNFSMSSDVWSPSLYEVQSLYKLSQLSYQKEAPVTHSGLAFNLFHFNYYHSRSTTPLPSRSARKGLTRYEESTLPQCTPVARKFPPRSPAKKKSKTARATILLRCETNTMSYQNKCEYRIDEGESERI